MRKYILYIIALLWCTPLFSQTTFIDSLELLIPKATIEERVKLKYDTEPYLLNIVDIQERLQETQHYVAISTKLKDSLLLEHAYWQLSMVYKALGDTLKSKEIWNKGKAIAMQYGHPLADNHSNTTSGITYTNTFIGVYKDSSRQMSFDSIQKCRDIFEINNTEWNLDLDAVYWCKMKLTGHPEKTDDYVFQISSDLDGRGSWNHIKAYLVHADGSVEEQQSGYALERAKKSIPYPANLLRFTIAQKEKATLYLRLEGVAENKKPAFISINLVNGGNYTDIDGGYEFKGRFYQDFRPRLPFVTNGMYHHEIVEDTVGTMDIESVYTNWQSLERKDWMDVKPTVGMVYWLKAKFIGSPIFNGEQVIHITDLASNDMHNFDFVDAYMPDGAGGFHHQRTGDKVPLSERPYDFWATFLKIDVPLNDTLELMVRLEGADPRFLPAQILINHVDESSIWPDQINRGLFEGIILGIFGIQAIYLLLLFFIERDRIHFYLCCYVIGCLIFFYLSPVKYFDFVALPFWKDKLYYLAAISTFLVFFGLVKFTQVYFNPSKSSYLSKWIIPIYLFILAIVMLLNYFGTGPFMILDVLYIVGGIAISLSLVVTSKKQEHISKSFFLLAFVPFFFILIVFYLLLFSINQNLIDASSTLFNYVFINQELIQNIATKGIPLSIVFSLVMLALSAGKRTNGLKAEKEKALQKNLADQKRVNQAISRFVPNEFLAALGKTNITEISLGDSIEKEVTVFFSDIRSYTSLSEQMTPAETFQFVNTYNALMGPVIQNNNGFINQYLGDGIMAIFPDSPTDSLRAAIQMQQVLQTYNQKRMAEGRSSIQVGMGMHTGSLIMGITGDADRLDAATISDSVNSAARIENLTKHYGAAILLSESCLDKLDNRSAFNVRYLGEVQVKGKQEAIKIYECFDGDLPAMVDLKLATLSEFESGVQHYFSQVFDLAQAAFEKVLLQNPTDKTAQLFLTKTKWLAEAGVAEDWTGVEMMEKQ